MFHLIGQLIFGLIIGALAKLLMPGKDPGGLLVTALIGLAGSALGTFVAYYVLHRHYRAGWVLSLLGALAILLVYRLVIRNKSSDT